MFDQRQWAELNAFAASFGNNNNNGGGDAGGQVHGQSSNQATSHSQRDQSQQHNGSHFGLHQSGLTDQHMLHTSQHTFFNQQDQHTQSSQRQQQQQQQQPPPHHPPAHQHHHHQHQQHQPQQQQFNTREQHEVFQYGFSPQQEWPRFDYGTSSQAGVSHSLQHHDSSVAFGTPPSSDMDWAPSSDFDGAFTTGFGTNSKHDATRTVKIEGDRLDHPMEGLGHHSTAVVSGQSDSGGQGVGRLIAQFENKDFQPPLPPRPSNNETTSTAVTSPININPPQPPPSHFNQFSAAQDSSSFASTSFAASFAGQRDNTPSDSHFGSFDTTHSRVASPVATSPPPASFGSFHDGARFGSPPQAPTSHPFGSLDNLMSSNRVGPGSLVMPTSSMVSSPAPTTPGHTTPGTPGFALWRPPGQHSQEHQHVQAHQQLQFQQQYQPQSQQSSFDAQSPPARQPSAIAVSPGGYFRPPVPPTPKPSTSAGNQFILELNPGSKAKGKAPVKPPKPKGPKPTLPAGTSTPLSPTVKQEPSTPLLEGAPESLAELTDTSGDATAIRPSMINRPSREQVPAEAWEGYKSTIHDLYLEQRKPLKEVMTIMAEQYNFQATPKMYKTRFSQWGFVKNNTEDEVKKLLSMKFQRDAEGKVSEFVRNGKIVNLGTYLKRKGVTEYDLVDFELPANLPSHIRCRTPTPPPAPEYLKSPDLLRAQELVVGNVRKAFLQCRQWELETEKQVGWPSTMVWGCPSSEMLTEANFYFEAGDVDSGGQCLMNAFNQLEMDLKQLSPQAIMEVLLGMVKRDPGLTTALCKYVAAFSTTNYDRAHPLRQILTCLYDVQQKHGAATLSELLWGSSPLIAEELEAIYGRRHPYVARTWADLAIFYDQRSTERLEKLALELRIMHRQMEQAQGSELSDLLALRYMVAQLFYAANPESDPTKQAAHDLLKDMKKAKLLFRVRDPRSDAYCYHCAVKNDPWTKRCRRRYDSVVEILEKHTEVKVHPYFEEDFHTMNHEPEPSTAWSAVMGQPQPMGSNKWGFL